MLATATRNTRTVPQTTPSRPALAPLAASRSIAGYGESVLTARKVARIVVDQVEYEVGPDVSLTAAYGNTGRALADDYVLSANYAALLFGVVHFAGVDYIEQLVLGLPGSKSSTLRWL
ncbi:hypothetical protein [Burkholderia gladioli]|uniref:ParM/StbA family protein n=1 Tax=Burkholderia gladioli TaxID=28095 RepID=UPI001FC89E9E|nr:hypothetical protein [Burkholderia gladioli]